jgi:hypothetical protein
MAKKIPVRNQITDSQIILEELFKHELQPIGERMVAEIMRKARSSTPAQRIKAVKELKWPGENAYLKKIKEASAEIALDAINNARKALPKVKRSKLTDEIDSIKLDDNLTTLLDQLPSDMKKKIIKNSELYVGAQLQDLEKTIQFQFASSHDTTDDMDILENDLKKAATEWISGNSITAGAGRLAATTINDCRNAFFFEPDVLDQIAAFEFVNGDPVTQICQDLAGTVFAKDDPNMFRYTPPLHWNCKSSIEPIPVGELGSQKIQDLQKVAGKSDGTIQFSEHSAHCAHCGQ